jgi:hypothetical protein
VVIDGPTPGLWQLITCPGSKSPAWADQSLKPANVLDEFKRHNDRVASADRSAALLSHQPALSMRSMIKRQNQV